MQIRFVKLAEKWFIDIPWIGDVNDLQMVDGADSLLEILAEGAKEFNCTVSTTVLMNRHWLAHLEKISIFVLVIELLQVANIHLNQ